MAGLQNVGPEFYQYLPYCMLLEIISLVVMKDKNMSNGTKFQSSSHDLQITSADFTHF